MSQQQPVSILVVDDFQPWRSQVRNILQERPEWKILSEAGDGPEAIKKATELEPDVTLLDVGLPSLNGIEAARDHPPEMSQNQNSLCHSGR
jgi:DNA-binding NarL/FixJ family response regulator